MSPPETTPLPLCQPPLTIFLLLGFLVDQKAPATVAHLVGVAPLAHLHQLALLAPPLLHLVLILVLPDLILFL